VVVEERTPHLKASTARSAIVEHEDVVIRLVASIESGNVSPDHDVLIVRAGSLNSKVVAQATLRVGAFAANQGIQRISRGMTPHS